MLLNVFSAKIIAISSTISGEGKTFLAINLAGIIAFTGKKVLIIDLDILLFSIVGLDRVSCDPFNKIDD